MAQEVIVIGAAANDGTGDPLRTALGKCNDNFAELYAAIVGMLDLKGATDCSANPNYPAATKGDMYLVSVAGRIGGVAGKAVAVGDAAIASADNAGGTEAAVGASWFVIEHQLATVLLAGNNLSDLANKAAARVNLQIARPYASGRYCLPDGPSLLTVTALAAPGTGVLTLTPGYLHEAVSVSSLCARVVGAAASGHFQIYVYAADPVTGQPTGAPVVSSAAISTAAAAVVEDSTASHTFAPGLYWWGVICDANANTATFATSILGDLSIYKLIGSGTLANLLVSVTGWAASGGGIAYGSPPLLTGNLTTDGFAAQSTAKCPLIGFKVA